MSDHENQEAEHEEETQVIDGKYQSPKLAEWDYNFTVTKATERQIINHPEFEAVCSQYWGLARGQPGANLSKNTIDKKQYTELMKRMLKVLLPLYRETEMAKEIAQEWLLDSCGEQEMNLLLFQKAIFRMAHTWAVHVDVKEYVELLQKVFLRITVKRVTRGSDGSQKVYLPTIAVEIWQRDLSEDEQPWEECADEVQDNDMFEYMDAENEHGGFVKMRRPKQEKKEENKNLVINGHEPLSFNERVEYFTYSDQASEPTEEDVIDHVFAEMRDVYPMGYPTEQFLTKVKNDVNDAFGKLKEQNKKTDDKKGHSTVLQNDRVPGKDPGMIEELGLYYEDEFTMHDHVNGVRIKTICHIRDNIYNQLRTVLKSETNLSIQPHFDWPSRATLSGMQAAASSLSEHFSEVNRNPGFNPALERRIQLKLVTSEYGTAKKKHFVNVNYMLVDPIYETAYRSDVRRVETAEKMSIQPLEEFPREEEFNPVTTSYKDLVRIMLQQKFEGLYQDKLQHQNKLYDAHAKKVYEAERARKKQVRFPDHLTSKGIDEVNREIKTDDLRSKRGPFYQLLSKEGILEDDFVSCTTKDLIEYANKEVLKVLIIGKPRSGKSTLARNLAQSLDLVRISVDAWITDFFARVQKRIDEPPEVEPVFATRINPETQEEEQYELPPAEWRTPLEVSVQTCLQQGNALSQEDIEAMIKQQLHSNLAAKKGFVLDLDFSKSTGKPWSERLIDNKIIDGMSFTHVVEIQLDDEEVMHRARNIRQNVQTGQVYSQWERDELRRPKPPKLDDDGNPIEEEEEVDEDGNPKKKIPAESELVSRACDESGPIVGEIDFYKDPEGERKAAATFIQKLYDSTFIKLDAAGMTPTELCDVVTFRIKPKTSEPLRPIAKRIEDKSDPKSLLEDEGDEEAGILPRRSQWSLWRKTDPVALLKGQVEEGIADFAVHYANNVFMFKNEENMNAFIENPRKFVSVPPSMPPDFRILLLGPRGVGKKTQAQMLSEFYGWRVVNFVEVVQRKLAQLLKMRVKPPNNFVKDGKCMICMSQEELDKIKEGHSLPAWKFLPWILEFLGVPMKRRPIVPKLPEAEPNVEEMTPEELKAYQLAQKKKVQEEAKKAKEQAEAEAAKKERDRKREEARAQGINPAEIGLEDTEEEIIIEDLPIDQLIIDTDKKEDGTIARVDKVILVGYPHSELHVEKLKEYGFGFDRLLYMTCKDEENPGKEVVKRNTHPDSLQYVWEVEDEAGKKQLTFAQEIMTTEEKPGAEQVTEIDCNGTPDEVFNKIRRAIDPFCLQPDKEEDIIVSADLQEDDDGNKPRLPRSDFGDYCPVTFVDEGFMIKGDPEQEEQINGRTYLFATEKERNLFKTNPTKYYNFGRRGLPLQPPQPKIMIIGNKGSGVTTQIRKLCDRFKLEEFELQKEYLKKVEQEQESRRRLRKLKRGFKAMPIDEETGKEEVDPEIQEDPDDFDRGAAEVKFMSELIDSKKGLIIDGHWTTLPEGAVEKSLYDLLLESKRMPEIVVVIKCKLEESTFKRCVFEDKITAKFEEIMAKRKADSAKKRADARKEAMDAKLEELKSAAAGDEEVPAGKIEQQLAEAMAEWDETDKEKPDDEYLEEEPPVLADMIQADKDAIREQFDKDNAFIDELVEQLKEKRVKVVENLNSDISEEYVHIKIVDKLKEHLKFRASLIEKEQAEVLKKKYLKEKETSYTYRHSKFGLSSPISPFSPTKTKDFAVLYRERIYFLANKEEQQQFLLEPSKYVKGVEAVPTDLLVKPKICVLGLPKSGKTSLCQAINQKTGAVHLTIESMIEDFIVRDSSFGARLKDLMKTRGCAIDDLNLIQLLCKRLERRDCRENGWVLEDFPKTRMQAKMMAQNGIVPTNVFDLDIPYAEVFKKSEAGNQEGDFGCNRQILKMRLDYISSNKPQVLYFYQKFYNSVSYLDGQKSRWFIQDAVLQAVANNIKARLEFARDFFFGMSSDRPCKMENMHVAREIMKQSLSQFGYFCPVTFKNERAYKHASHLSELTVLFRHMFYFFSSVKERDAFIHSPDLFTQKIVFSGTKRTPNLLKSWKAAEMASNEKELNNYCPVSLKDAEKIEDGNHSLLVKFDGKNFIFANADKARVFATHPHRYFKTQLPVKLPPPKAPVGLYGLSKKTESITFLEQALGNVVTKGLREVGESRLKYPTLSIKETSLKLFALFLKCENPANTDYMRDKYRLKCKDFLDICTISEELFSLAEEKEKKQAKGRWPQFKEDYYNELGRKYDEIMERTEKDRVAGFWDFMK